MPKKKVKNGYDNPIPEPVIIPSRNNAAAKRWLWIWVSFFTVIILGLWGWAAKINLGSVRWSQSPEKKLIDSRQEDWDDLFNSEADRIKHEQTKLQLKNVLGKIITALVTSTPTTTTVSATTTPTSSSSTTSTP